MGAMNGVTGRQPASMRTGSAPAAVRTAIVATTAHAVVTGSCSSGHTHLAALMGYSLGAPRSRYHHRTLARPRTLSRDEPENDGRVLRIDDVRPPDDRVEECRTLCAPRRSRERHAHSCRNELLGLIAQAVVIGVLGCSLLHTRWRAELVGRAHSVVCLRNQHHAATGGNQQPCSLQRIPTPAPVVRDSLGGSRPGRGALSSGVQPSGLGRTVNDNAQSSWDSPSIVSRHM